MMKSLLFLSALLTATHGSPLEARQMLDIGIIEDASKPSIVSFPIEVASQAIHYDLAAATAAATESPLPVATTTEDKRNVIARSACDPLPSGHGPTPAPDTVSAFET
jgi:hypothetical protein